MREPSLEEMVLYIKTPRVIRHQWAKQRGTTAPTQEQAVAIFCDKLLRRLRLMEQTLAARGIVVEERTPSGLITVP